MTLMTPSAVQPITDGQIDKAVATYRDMLCKRRSKLGSAAVVQHVLGQPGYVAEQVAVLCKRVKAVSGMITRHVTVDRARTPQQVLDGTGYKQHVSSAVVATMPRGQGKSKAVYFFRPREESYDENGAISDDNLVKEYDWFGLRPDPYAQAAVHEADPTFANKRPNGTHWKDADGYWWNVTFRNWHGCRRDVYVLSPDLDWSCIWLFGGVPK